MEEEVRARQHAASEAAAAARHTFSSTLEVLDAFVDQCVGEFVPAAQSLWVPRSDLEQVQRIHPSVRRRRGARWLIPVFVYASEGDDHARSNVVLVRKDGAWMWAHPWSALPNSLSDLQRSHIRNRFLDALSTSG
ncbi:hypothetical protein GCM10010531_38740 [Blastococcus jejuensis]|uniref:Uncharacterized protein n=2 Tax=Blastococcus jejuensis TaxID=351224 RepID=A0ABP6PJC6_9ACTN